jgi:hypothetical protein
VKAPTRTMNESVAKKSKEMTATPEEVLQAIMQGLRFLRWEDTPE